MLDPVTLARLGRIRQAELLQQATRARLSRQARRRENAAGTAGLRAMVQRVGSLWRRRAVVQASQV